MLIYRAANVENVLSPAQCELVIERAHEEGWSPGEVWTTEEPLKSRVDTRWIRCDRSKLEDEWLLLRLRHVFDEMNDKFWHFDIDGTVSARVARYQEGGFFGMHVDLGGGLGFNRKLTMSVNLSDPNDYDGGLLCLQGARHAPAMEQGDATMYPSFIPHEVREVEAGERYSLIAWVDGQKPFR